MYHFGFKCENMWCWSKIHVDSAGPFWRKNFTNAIASFFPNQLEVFLVPGIFSDNRSRFASFRLESGHMCLLPSPCLISPRKMLTLKEWSRIFWICPGRRSLPGLSFPKMALHVHCWESFLQRNQRGNISWLASPIVITRQTKIDSSCWSVCFTPHLVLPKDFPLWRNAEVSSLILSTSAWRSPLIRSIVEQF